MRLHRFYLSSPISAGTFDVSDRDLVHQWKKVFRYNVGSQVVVFDGSGTDYHCVITSLRNLGATLQTMKKVENNSNQRNNVWLCMALVKKDNLEWAVQKATEIGVTNIVPILCEHSEKKKFKTERMNKILIEASEQSGRGDIPVIHPIQTVSQILDSGILPQEKAVFHPSGIPFGQYKAATSARSFAAFVGPEGGWSEKEIAFFREHNIPLVSLGQQILRAETAAVAVSALLII